MKKQKIKNSKNDYAAKLSKKDYAAKLRFIRSAETALLHYGHKEWEDFSRMKKDFLLLSCPKQ